jgi:acyl-coenzyme A thioesterase PaaI-like protein
MENTAGKQPNSHDCFICGIRNEAGVRAAFYETQTPDGTPAVEARWIGRADHQGYPGRMHGGVSAGVLDEVMARCITMGDVALEPPVWGVTAEMSVRYLAPVPLGVELTALGWITRERSRLFETEAELRLPDGTVAARATGKYLKLPLDDIAGIDTNTLGWRVYADGQ